MKIIITGGAGFIGTNTALYFLKKKYSVVIIDNLSRKGSKTNLDWLTSLYPALSFLHLNIADYDALSSHKNTFADADVIIHLAGQVAVTKSVMNPRRDFEDNALGTFNILECIRKTGSKAKLIYASTNKVYGGLESELVREAPTRYEFVSLRFGIDERHPVDFHSPYGCSKGAAEQYVHDYARIYDLDTVVFRQSCIYGPHQFGIEDQGWLAWLTIAGFFDKPITINGNGKQVRDILYIDDLIQAYEAAIGAKSVSKGNIYNIGGGILNTISIWQEFGPKLEKILDKSIPVTYTESRPGDQRIYVSDIRKVEKELKWMPNVSIDDGLSRLKEWITKNSDIYQKALI